MTEGHWKIDTVVGKRAGKESVVLTLVENKTDYYMAIKIPGKDPDSVMTAIDVLREEYGEEHFNDIFKSVTADNGSEFLRLSELEAYGVSVYFAHHVKDLKMSVITGYSGDIFPNMYLLKITLTSRPFNLQMK